MSLDRPVRNVVAITRLYDWHNKLISEFMTVAQGPQTFGEQFSGVVTVPVYKTTCELRIVYADEEAPREEWPSVMDGAETPFADNH
jgi:hypothetical protein